MQWANDGIAALNDMMGVGGHRDLSSPVAACSIAASQHVLSSYSDIGPPPADLGSCKECFSSLLASSSSYNTERRDIRPYARELVSWPKVGSARVVLADSLPSADRDRLRTWKQSLLREPSEVSQLNAELGDLKPYNDPALFRSPKVYGEFLMHLHGRGDDSCYS